MNGGILHVWNKILKWLTAVCSRWRGRIWWQSSFPEMGGIGGLPVVEELMAHQLPGKSQRDRTLTAPLISRVESSVLKLEHHWTSLARAWGMSVGRSVMWVGYRWSRYWSCRGCTERKRTAVLGALTVFQQNVLLYNQNCYQDTDYCHHCRKFPSQEILSLLPQSHLLFRCFHTVLVLLLLKCHLNVIMSCVAVI